VLNLFIIFDEEVIEMTAEEILREVEKLDKTEKEKFYFKVMEGYFKAMMADQKFMEEAFNCMASYLNKMKDMGLDVNAVLMEMETGLGVKKAKAA
jgi:hypothetical protein